ncbi:hypothetical protein AVJ23_01130 [Pseudoponticoccus marisrubri]|uniref:DUF218 domain-containing protein n=1 Tax=Pseudoponticoccus marisrubri TaxID=1685382 RepID=A0A0W7WP55_9RHOB|nr:hypothetical protein AVJ23_01130 [Pseudoponticoccus marisrubri]
MRRAALAFLLLCLLLPTLSRFVTPPCTDRERPVEIAVVLGGGASARGLGPDTASRVDAGVALFDRGLARHLHMTGGGTAQDGLTIGAAMAQRAIAAGVPPAQVSWEGASQSTLENALFSRPALPAGEKRILVTESFHSLRAAASFAWAGRPGAICAAPAARRSARGWLWTRTRETLAWGWNLPRALVWSAAAVTGLQDALPETWLE